ncbi:hypothetical protein GCM10010251_03960 [Streptomyces aurantiogriseus]|uniref:Uncharacterized protein n=1 Tax=Streptomyces aurantiogriseus TaxID=66870 RepID=A0A918BV96_9ACTN|nr:hypothetical protein GCM10010251_03960 [Streptomyces aurantiogriseus]
MPTVQPDARAASDPVDNSRPVDNPLRAGVSMATVTAVFEGFGPSANHRRPNHTAGPVCGRPAGGPRHPPRPVVDFRNREERAKDTAPRKAAKPATGTAGSGHRGLGTPQAQRSCSRA